MVTLKRTLPSYLATLGGGGVGSKWKASVASHSRPSAWRCQVSQPKEFTHVMSCADIRVNWFLSWTLHNCTARSHVERWYSAFSTAAHDTLQYLASKRSQGRVTKYFKDKNKLTITVNLHELAHMSGKKLLQSISFKEKCQYYCIYQLHLSFPLSCMALSFHPLEEFSLMWSHAHSQKTLNLWAECENRVALTLIFCTCSTGSIHVRSYNQK